VGGSSCILGGTLDLGRGVLCGAFVRTMEGIDCRIEEGEGGERRGEVLHTFVDADDSVAEWSRGRHSSEDRDWTTRYE